MLARAAAHEDGDAEPRHHGVGESRPTTIVTVEPGFGLRAAGRILGEDDPVLARVGRVLVLDVDDEARLLERLRRRSSSWLVTSGIVDSFGPFETISVTVEPRAAEVAAGSGSGR